MKARGQNPNESSLPKRKRKWCSAPQFSSAMAAMAFRCWWDAMTFMTGWPHWALPTRTALKCIIALIRRWCRRWSNSCTSGCRGAAICGGVVSAWSIVTGMWWRGGGYGMPVLVGRNDVYDRLAALGIAEPNSFEVHNSVNSPLVPKMVEFLYQRLQRRGYLRRDCERMVNRDRNIFGALLLQLNEAEAMITGLTRTY